MLATRMVVPLLIGALLTGAGAWVTWARTVPSKAEVIELIETRSPYLQDRRLLEERTGKELTKLREEVEELSVQMSRLSAVLERIEKNVDRRVFRVE